MTFTLLEIDESNLIVMPANQPVPPIQEIADRLGHTDFTINTQTTSATTNRRQLGSDMKGNPHTIAQTTFQQPIVTHTITLKKSAA